ncbi:MAG TPA: PorT family protein [Prolixibacteraceae bacterium]|jgi:hypothetical protein|nr:PorT family protein [Prolixibacteraceae bacterium]
MKNKNLFLIAIMVMFGLSAMSQEDQKISFGLRGGVNFQNINGKDVGGDKLNADMLTGFNAGVVIQIPVAPEFYFQSGLLYTTKGAKSDNFQGTGMAVKLTPSYLELPLNLLYRPLLGQGHLLLGFGPYVAYGLGGKAKLGNNEYDIIYAKEYSSLLPYGQYLKRFDFGGNLFFGYELSNGISLQLNTQLGLAKINSDNTNPLYSNSKASFKNTGFGLSLGYMF